MLYPMYVDDLQIGFKSCNLAICEEHVHVGLNNEDKRVNENGFSLNPQKSTRILFSNKRGIILDPNLKLSGSRRPKVENKNLLESL